MPMPAYVSIEGATQGLITSGATSGDSIGNFYQDGHTDESMVQGFAGNVTIPRDPQSGQPTGVRRHEPAMITKYFDKASPLLWQALCTGETLKITLKFYRVNTLGVTEHYFTIVWTDAVLVDGRGYLPNALNPENAPFGNMEDWSFTYRKVEWTHEVAGTSGADDWRAPKV